MLVEGGVGGPCHRDAESAMADEAADVLDRLCQLDGMGITVEIGPLDVDWIRPEICEVVLVQRAVVRSDRKSRKTTVPGHLGRDALADLVYAGRCRQKCDIGV